MKDLDSIEEILNLMVLLLSAGGYDEWAVELKKVKACFRADPEKASLKVLSMFGGMGSINDVVLYVGGQPLVRENNDFDNLRSRLYEFCKEIS